jgi:hypothetical protein
VICRTCKRKVHIGDFPFCPHDQVTRTPAARDLRGLNTRIWTGEQVYGRKYLQSERGQQDTIDAISGSRRYGLIKG